MEALPPIAWWRTRMQNVEGTRDKSTEEHLRPPRSAMPILMLEIAGIIFTTTAASARAITR